MSLIGNKKPASGKGFTLIEVLVTTAVLSFGMVSIFQALFIIMSAFSYISHYLNVVPIADEKVWQVQNAVRCDGPQAVFDKRGIFDAGGKKYDWTLSAVLADKDAMLYKIDLVTSWSEGRRNNRLARSAYVFYEQETTEKQ